MTNSAAGSIHAVLIALATVAGLDPDPLLRNGFTAGFVLSVSVRFSGSGVVVSFGAALFELAAMLVRALVPRNLNRSGWWLP